ncbi:hypothetical protein CABS01_10857 [Colletotrichum abscissum]|nr:uncharacterized protein CABS01_10857 [Colletotrichum abscissum]KAK1497879.1 hypothetical protein CABS01_10857 [Colletotrichum abscissum]
MPTYYETSEELRPELEAIRDSIDEALRAFQPSFSRAKTAETLRTDAARIKTSLKELQSLWNGREMNQYWIAIWTLVKKIITKKIILSEENAERALNEITASTPLRPLSTPELPDLYSPQRKYTHPYSRHKLAYGLSSKIMKKISNALVDSWENPEDLTHVEFFYILTWISNTIGKEKSAWFAIEDVEWSNMVTCSYMDIREYIARQPFSLPTAITPMDRLALYYIVPESKDILQQIIPKLVGFMDHDIFKQEDVAREIYDLGFLPAPISAKDVPEAARRRAKMTDPYLKKVVGSAMIRGLLRRWIEADPDPVSILKLTQVRVEDLCSTLEDEVLSLMD